jgi:hypothetical protein
MPTTKKQKNKIIIIIIIRERERERERERNKTKCIKLLKKKLLHENRKLKDRKEF